MPKGIYVRGQSLEERFWSKAEKTDSCWNWKSNMHFKGYGLFSLNGKTVKAHRIAFELSKGQILEGLTIDHLCRNRRCVNPSHLEAVSMKENTLRGNGPSAIHSRKTHCKKGHELTSDNMVPSYLKKGERRCLTCWRAYTAKWMREHPKKRRVL